jgi:D-psicose/D-tagatose/L-ribulose 3-epimerase
MDWHTRWIQEAGECGAIAYTGALYGHPGNVLKGIPDPDLFSRTAGRLHELAETAAKCGVQVVLEPMSHFRTHVVNTAEQAANLVRLADHPNLKILLDTYHLVTEIRDYALAVQQAQPFLWGIHACENDRGIPGGGLVPWNSLCQSLHANGFDGWMIMESYNSHNAEFAFSRGMFHNVCPDGDLFVQQGLQFLQHSLSSAAPPE